MTDTLHDALRNFINGAQTVNAHDRARLGVIALDRFCLLMIYTQSVTDRLFGVISTAQFLTPLYHAPDQFFFRSIKRDDPYILDLDLLEERIERCGLIDSTWKSIKKESPLMFHLLEKYLLDKTDDHVIGHQAAGFDMTLGYLAEFCAAGNSCAQHIACRDVVEIVGRGQELSLCAFTYAGRSEKNDIHARSIKRQTAVLERFT